MNLADPGSPAHDTRPQRAGLSGAVTLMAGETTTTDRRPIQ